MVVDCQVEQLICDCVVEMWLGDGVLGEEFDEMVGISGFCWVFDLIDGIKLFIYYVLLFGMLIGLEYEGQMVVGVCWMLVFDEVVFVGVGLGAWWQQGVGQLQEVCVLIVD